MFVPPIADVLLAMRTAGQLGSSLYPDVSVEDADAILTEAGKFAADHLAPLNWTGDLQGARLVDGRVVTADGWREAYNAWAAAGWNGVAAPEDFGGQGLPMTMAVACTEFWNAANMSFALCPLLTAGAIEALNAHGSPALKQQYLPKMASGEWTGTMNLTEPQSGSDLSGIRCKAERAGDGSYRITGSKIYITYGDHDCAENIIHLVLARLPDAPAGTRGISLFLVPKILPDKKANDVQCHSLEHKLGIKASPTCTMIYGDKGGAVGWLIGEENRGLNCMFTMMNNARLLVGVQGVGLAERATQRAIAYAKERKQGKAFGVKDGQSAIIQHGDVKRMLLDMQSKTAAARMLCMATATAIDASTRGESDDQKQNASAMAALLTPLAKSYSTDIAVEVASTGVQVHGGMGFVEETGAAQHYRDARILPIYEGTNGIQAVDLVTRKLTLQDGQTLKTALDECAVGGKATLAIMERAVTVLRNTSKEILQREGSIGLSAATPFTRALAVTIAASYLLKAINVAEAPSAKQKAETLAVFFVLNEVVAAVAACETAVACASTIEGASFK
jgi:acyl-CoA dehydrogenase